MKKIVNEYSIELDKVLKEYQSNLSEVEREEVIRYINVLEENLHFFRKIMENKDQIEDMVKHISKLGEEKWQEKN